MLRSGLGVNKKVQRLIILLKTSLSILYGSVILLGSVYPFYQGIGILNDTSNSTRI